MRGVNVRMEAYPVEEVPVPLSEVPVVLVLLWGATLNPPLVA